MKTDSLEITDEGRGFFLSLRSCARRMIARISKHRKARAREHDIEQMLLHLGEIPTQYLEDIGIDEYRLMEMQAKANRIRRGYLVPFFPVSF